MMHRRRMRRLAGAGRKHQVCAVRDGGSRSEAHLQAEADLVRIRESSGQLAGEAAEARVLDAQAERRIHVVTKPDTDVHAVAWPPVYRDGRRTQHRRGLALRIADAAVKGELP